MYHILKIGDSYVGPDGQIVYDRASALRVDAATVRAMKKADANYNVRLVTVTLPADRAARRNGGGLGQASADPQAAR